MVAATALSPDAVQQLIEHRFDSLSPELQRAARWVRQHGASMALHSMRESAREAGVTPATMTRLAQRLGFDGFETLRAPYRRQLASTQSLPYLERARAQQRQRDQREPDQLAQLNALQQANVASVATLNSADSLANAAEAMLGAARVFFLGLRVCHGLAFHLHYAYGLIKPNGTLLNDLGGTMPDQVLQMTPGDLLVAVSQTPYTRQTVEIAELARRRNIATLVLTDSALSPIARGAQHVLLFDTASTSFFHSITGAQALAESLLAAVAARGGEAVLQRLRRMQTHLRATRAHWERSPK
jgi:DNA-binding MurR/RpiR family transcriptional regulator